MRHLQLIIVCLCCTLAAQAQRISHDFQGVSLSEALIWIDNAQDSHKLNFIFDELEDFTVTTTVKNANARDAVRQVCGFYPVRISFDERDIYIECTQKAETKLSGHIQNENGQPIAYANIALLAPDDSTFITGGVSNEAGDFVIPCAAHQVIARISCVGYRPVERKTIVSHIGTVSLSAETYTLRNVNIKGMKRITTATDRGLMTLVKDTPLADFGSVSEMLSHLPLMMGDGTIAGHGKPLIYLNNKLVRNEAELERYRADEILTAEIITNPGVEYGINVGSVIRLKTIRRTGEGWSGNFSAAYRQGKAHYASLNAALNYRFNNGMDFFARGYLTDNHQLRSGHTHDQLQAASTWDYQKQMEWRFKNRYYFADLGWNWELNEHHSLGITYTANNNIGDSKRVSEYDERTWQDGTLIEDGRSVTNTLDKPRMSHAVNAYYVGEIGKWKIDFSADYYGGKSASEMAGGTDGSESVGSQTNTKNNLLAEILIVTAPVPKGTLTFGEEASGTDRTSDFAQSGFSADNSVHQQTTIWSLFANYALKVNKKLSLNAGLRWQNEYNDYEQNGQKNAEMSPDYHVVVPRLIASYQAKKWHHNLIYSRSRTNPPYGILSSSINYRTKYEYDTGNPYLKPNTSDLFAIESVWKWVYIGLAFEYHKNDNLSFQYAYDDVNHPGVMIMDYRNVPRTRKYRAIVNLSPKIGIWQMNYTANFSVKNSDLEAIGITHNWKGLCADFDFDNTLTLPHKWLLNVNASITPYQENGASQKKATGNLSVRISKRFLKDKSLNAALFVKDLLHTQYREMTAYGGINIRTQFKEYSDARRVGIDLAWRFNATKSRYKGSHAGQSERDRL